MLAYLSIGANLPGPWGGAREMVLGAVERVAGARGIVRVRASSVWRTAAWGLAGQPDFANLVVEVETLLAPEALLALGHSIEAEAGRSRGERWGPRPLDVDLLLAGSEVRVGPPLDLPHPRLRSRRFVLVPLAELAPDVLDPVSGRTAAELLAATSDRARVEPWPGLETVGV